MLNSGTVAINVDDFIRPTIEALKNEPVIVLIVPVVEVGLNNFPENMRAELFIPF